MHVMACILMKQARKAMQFTVEHAPPDGLYPNFINPNTGTWCNRAFLRRVSPS